MQKTKVVSRNRCCRKICWWFCTEVGVRVDIQPTYCMKQAYYNLSKRRSTKNTTKFLMLDDALS